MIQLTPLPYDYSALNPIISTETLQYHYDKHHAGYVAKTNELIKNSPMDEMDLESIVLIASKDTALTQLFNQSAQVWNHDFYWKSLSNQEANHYLSDALLEAVFQQYGSLTTLKKEMVQAGVNHFASGWLWLVVENGKLKIMTTSNAHTPLTNSLINPLLGIDLWEHAYYLDWQNLRKDYLNGIMENLLNWQFASQNFSR